MKKYFSVLLILLLPNFLRQFVYYFAQMKTGSAAFIASFETQLIFAVPSFPWIGIGEELFIGLIYAGLFLFSRPTQFFAYGWIGDVIIDFAMVACFLLFGTTPLLALGLGPIARFVVREVILGYLCLGIPATVWKFNLKKWAIVGLACGLVVLLLCL